MTPQEREELDDADAKAASYDRASEPARSTLGFVDLHRVGMLLARWRERQAQYEAEYKEAAARGRRGNADRLAAADIAMEVRACIRELENLIGAGEGHTAGHMRAGGTEGVQ